MIDRRYLIGGVIGAALFAVGSTLYSQTANCGFGTARQQSLDIATYELAMLEALSKAYSFNPLEDVTLAEAAGAASLVWSHLRQCIAQRGAEYCQTIGTTRDVETLRASRIPRTPGQGDDLVLEEAEQHRYLVPATVPGPSFELLFVPVAQSGKTELIMDFPERSHGYRFQFHFFWKNCTDGHTNSTIRLASIEDLKGATDE